MRRVVERSQVRQHPGELFDLVELRRVKLSAAPDAIEAGAAVCLEVKPRGIVETEEFRRDRSLEASLGFDALCEGLSLSCSRPNGVDAWSLSQVLSRLRWSGSLTSSRPLRTSSLARADRSRAGG